MSTVRSDFAMIDFSDHLGDNEGDLETSFNFHGDLTPVYPFGIDQEPIFQHPFSGYLTIQTFDVHDNNHRVVINGRDLPGFDIAAHASAKTWNSWTIGIPPGILRRGRNTIQVRRGSGGDNFLIKDVVVHWRELTPFG